MLDNRGVSIWGVLIIVALVLAAVVYLGVLGPFGWIIAGAVLLIVLVAALFARARTPSD